MSNVFAGWCWCQVQPRVGQRGAVSEHRRVLPRLWQLRRVAALQPVSVHRHRRLLLVSQLRGGVSVVSQRVGVGMTLKACPSGCIVRWGCNNIYFVDGGYTERNVNPLMSTRSSVMVNF